MVRSEVSVPAAVWDARPDVLLSFDLPDAVSLHELGQGADTRRLALGTRSITFRTVPGAAP